MKLTCQIVQDLLPLYEDGVCSEESRHAVEEHLCECMQCKTLCSAELPSLVSDAPMQDRAVKEGLRKIRRRWRLSVIAIAMILPIVLLSLLAYHEYRREGVCFSNLNELWSCYRFLDAVEDGDMKKATSYCDFSSLYREYREAIEMTPEDLMPSYVEVKIGGEEWMAYDWFAKEYLSGENELRTWQTLLHSNHEQAMIPVDVWDRLTAQEQTQRLQGQGYRMPNGTCYFPYETAWGSFMLKDTLWDHLQETANKTELSDWVAMMPKEMYLAIEPELETRAQEAYAGIQERMKDIIELNEAAFQDYMETRYAQKLASVDFTLSETSYHDCYRSDETWQILFKAKMTYQDEVLQVYFQFNAQGGKITHLSVNEDWLYSDQSEHYDIMYDIFTPRLS